MNTRIHPHTTARQQRWAATMAGPGGPEAPHGAGPTPAGIRLSHPGPPIPVGPTHPSDRNAREAAEDRWLAPGATRAHGAGDRAAPEAPDPHRTCFERDRDRILHATAFRRLAGKTQVFIFPADHQRTRLTHALEVAQVATAVARAGRLNVALTEAIALGHDCGHGPGGHASEDAFDPLVPGGFDHAPWGADVTLAPLNLCSATLDGIRNHSWSRPGPTTAEGAVVSWADRIAYVCHDFEDAVAAGVVTEAMLPKEVADTVGRQRRQQLDRFINGLVQVIEQHGLVGLPGHLADALAAFRAFNYEHIYLRPASITQADTVIRMLRSLVAWYVEHPQSIPARAGPPSSITTPSPMAEASPEAVRAAVSYVAGMTDRYAWRTAVDRLGWDRRSLPRGVDLGS